MSWLKKILIATLIVMVIAVIAMSINSVVEYQRDAKYQVRAMPDQRATNVKPHLLTIKAHISKATRPQEHFSFPIPLGQSGPVVPLYAGSPQYPFYCMSRDSMLGQPLVDNQQGVGVRVYDEKSGEVIGFSQDCSLASRLDYYLISSAGEVKRLIEQQGKLLLNGKLVQLQQNQRLIRVETGTINRFIYALFMPISPDEVGNRLSKHQWNQKLIYQFNGGSGIGFRQGRMRVERTITKRLEQLKQGYAVASSSGNRTSYTYNMVLAEDTMRRVKHQFISLYGEPEYTIGIGGSGGAIAQYLIAQNSDGLLDGLIPQYSYPDMVSQTLYALDCDLFNNYYTYRADKFQRWQKVTERELVEGMNSSQDIKQRTGFMQPIAQIYAGMMPNFPTGNSECINGWFGLSSYIANPRQGFLRPLFNNQIVEQTHWSYWQDMALFYGKDKYGFARSPWSNEGIQYGLNALINEKLTIEEFLHLNRHIGSWKPQHQMQQEAIVLPFGHSLPVWLTLWGRNNVSAYDETSGRAPRFLPDEIAIEQAYRSGQIFIGDVSIPIIDVRHYLEEQLDMHHVSASFSARARLTQFRGDHDNQVIWVAHEDFDPTNLAFEKLDEWLTNQAKPEGVNDACFDSSGNIMASGEGVWHGRWNSAPQGACSKAYPVFSNSRIEAGGLWQGSIFKCQLISVEHAIKQGLYHPLNMRDYQVDLKEVFPHGVCDLAQGEQWPVKDLIALLKE